MYYNDLEIVLNSSMPRFYCSHKLYKDYHYYSLLLLQWGSKCVEMIFFFCNNLKCSNALNVPKLPRSVLLLFWITKLYFSPLKILLIFFYFLQWKYVWISYSLEEILLFYWLIFNLPWVALLVYSCTVTECL